MVSSSSQYMFLQTPVLSFQKHSPSEGTVALGNRLIKENGNERDGSDADEKKRFLGGRR